jgi:hypothetical protein
MLDYEVFISKDKHHDAEKWCREKLGKRWNVLDNREGIWSCFWAGTRNPNAGKYRYAFKNQKDAVWFTLRWS